MTSSRSKLTLRSAGVPGPRKRVTLDIAEDSLPALIEGVDNVRVWLHEIEPDVYTFRATQTVKESRTQPGEPAIDVLTELVNELGDELDHRDVPQRLRDKWDEMVERYAQRTVPR